MFVTASYELLNNVFINMETLPAAPLHISGLLDSQLFMLKFSMEIIEIEKKFNKSSRTMYNASFYEYCNGVIQIQIKIRGVTGEHINGNYKVLINYFIAFL